MHKPSFNKSQKEAILHHEGACLVLAGPGSGKTTVMINRILHLIKECGVKPSEILAITFTKAAANELKERYQKACQGEEMIQFGTFHSIFFQILQSHFHYQEHSFITRKEKEKWIFYLCEKQQPQFIKEIHMEEILKIFSMWKNGVEVPMDQFEEGVCSTIKEIYQSYNLLLKEENKMDYDDVLFRCQELLLQNPKLCREWDERFRYVMVDEFQDISPIQYSVLKLIVKHHNNIFAVGDDDQSIYSFRGANPAITREFLGDFKAKQIVLDTNYRSTKEIVDVSLKVIRKNKNRIDKQLQAFQSERNMDSVEIQGFETIQKQMEYFCKRIQEKSDVLESRVILCRTNRECKKIADCLSQQRISYKMREKKQKLADRLMIKVVASYVKWLLGDNSRTNFLILMNCPNRNILRCWIKECVSKEELLLMAGTEEKKEIEKLFVLRELTKEWRPELIVRYLLSAVGVQRYFEKKNENETKEISQFLLQSVRGCGRLQEWVEYLEGTETEMKDKNDICSDLQIMTVHASKGLEFDEVWILNCNEGIFPAGKQLSEEEIEEERRIFYVAMTRAKKRLHLCYLKGTEDNRMECSRFISCLK